MPLPFETDRAERVRRNRLYLALGASPFAIAIAQILGAIAAWTPAPLVVLPHVFFLGVALTWAAWRKNKSPRFEPVKLRADDKGVWLGGELVAPKEQIKSGLVLPRWDGGPVLRISRKGLRLPVDLRVPDVEHARGILRALGLDASQSVAQFRLPSMALADPDKRKRGMVVFAAAMMAMAFATGIIAKTATFMAPVFPFVVALFAIAATAITAIPSRLMVGADGLHYSWLRSRRFVAYGDVARIDTYVEEGRSKNSMCGLLVLLKSGDTVRIPIMGSRQQERDELHMVHERISEALDTWSRGEGVAHAALVRRGGRAPSQWVQALRGIGAGANADARTAPVVPERLWRIVEDPSAPADARAGAAVALAQTADDEARARLKTAAAATAAPKLRIAIETAATAETDEAIAAALSELEAEQPSQQRA